MSPRDVAASVRQRLLNLARDRGEDFGLMLTLYALERVLYRLSVSGHHDQFVLKGALLFALLADDPHRPTFGEATRLFCRNGGHASARIGAPLPGSLNGRLGGVEIREPVSCGVSRES